MFYVGFIRRSIRSCEVYGYFESLFNLIEGHKLGSVVGGDRMQLPSSFEKGKLFDKNFGNGFCLSSFGQRLNDGKIGFSIRERQDGFIWSGYDDQVRFEITSTLLMIDTGGPAKNAAPWLLRRYRH